MKKYTILGSMKNIPLLSLLALLTVLGCKREFRKKELKFQNMLYGKEWVEIKRNNIWGGLYSNYGERYKADWDLIIDSSGFVNSKIPKKKINHILLGTDSLLQWDKYKYRVISLKADTLVLQYIPNKGDTINKPHNLTFIPKVTYDKLSIDQKKFSVLSKIDTLFMRKLADSCKSNPLYRFHGETFPRLIPLVSNVSVDTSTFISDGFLGTHREIEYNVQEFNSNTKYQHAYSGKFIVRENGELAAFDVGLLAMYETILPETAKYIEQFMKKSFKYIPATTLGVQHNTYVYFTLVRNPQAKSESTKQIALR
ncbi:hypothetical protein [Solitalea koreensis]|uniref:Lipoprotein n=1 Tax=Solitalea koreensis TaxID=543615 RepID=A0A521DA67_9SPHI|nr:hypothetical protein [Solitalea koreensis]SMO68525.1 hypothetical protein SAMN06265350_106111 [Solitalea koreensis]